MKQNEKTNGQVQITQIEVDGIKYINTRPNYYYKSENGKQIRISKTEWEQAFDAYIAQVDEADEEWDAEDEIEARKDAEEQKNRETEDVFNKKHGVEIPKSALEANKKYIEKSEKKASKPRKSKDIAHTTNGVTLTAKQVAFIKRMPEDDFYEHGLDSTLWIDVFADTVADQFNPMAVGAMVSTLREKNLISVGVERVNGKKSKYMAFTELGKKVAKDLGLN